MAFQRRLPEACADRPLPTFPRAPSLTLPRKRGREVSGKSGRVGRGRWRPIAVAAALVTAIAFAGCSGTLNSVDLSRRNAADMALAELGDRNLALLPKDDGGTGQGAQIAVQQAIDEGAQIVLGPLFAHSVTSAKPVARDRGIPLIAFSTDSNVAATGTYLLSFLPESDVDRVVAYAISQGKRSFIGLVPGSAYGSVVEGEFKQSVARRGGRVMALEHYDGRNKIGDAARLVAQAAGGADALFIPDGGEAVNEMIAALAAAGVNVR